MGKSNFMADMERGKLLAQAKRNRGIPTGKAAKGHVRKASHRHTPAKGSWDRLLTETRARWHHAAGMAKADYAWAVNPSRDDIESFIASGGTL